MTIDALGHNHPMLTGNLFAILSSGLIHTAWSLAAPQNFEWGQIEKNIKLIDDKLPEFDDPDENDDVKLIAAKNWIMKWGIGFTILMAVIWPLLTLPAGCGSDAGCGVFSKEHAITT